jgi:hypothetical protein
MQNPELSLSTITMKVVCNILKGRHVNIMTKQVTDKIVDKFKAEIVGMSVEETFDHFENLKLQLSKARIPLPREIVQLVTQKRDRNLKAPAAHTNSLSRSDGQ